jgi:hypothetical protein
MELENLKNNLILRLDEWGLNDAYREANEDFPFLGKINNINVSYTLQLVESFPKEEQIKVFVGLTKIAYQKKCSPAVTELTSEEKYLLDVYQQKQKLFPIYSSYIYDIVHNKNSFLRIPIKKLKSLILQELNAVMECQNKSGNHLNYMKIIDNNWSISTIVSVEKTGYSYSHIIGFLPSDKTFSNYEDIVMKRFCLVGKTSLFTWLGFATAGSIFLQEEDSIRNAKTIAKACSHFFNSFPAIVGGAV